MSHSFAGLPCLDPINARDACLEAGLDASWFGLAGQYVNPIGRGPGNASILLSLDAIQKIDTTRDWPLVFMDDAGDSIALQKLTLIKARCLTPGARGDGLATFLCDLVDRRHFLAMIPIDQAFNIRNIDGSGYLPQSMYSITSAWTWAQVWSTIWTAIGIAAPALPFTPSGTPENLIYWGGYAWEAANDLADRMACGIRYDPVGDAFTLVRLGEPDASAAASLAAADTVRTSDAYWQEPNRGKLPQYVRVLFPRRPAPVDGSSIFYTVDAALTPSSAGVQAGTYEILHDDLTAIGAGTPANAAALTTRADERAADWQRKRLGYEARLTIVYRDHRLNVLQTAGSTVGGTALDDRGGPFQTEVNARPDGILERWMPYVQPLVLMASSGGTTGFWARMIARGGGPYYLYSYVQRTSNNGVWSDTGSVSGYVAAPAQFWDGNGGALGAPVVETQASSGVTGGGAIVWMYPSLTPGQMEFLPWQAADYQTQGDVSTSGQFLGNGNKFISALGVGYTPTYTPISAPTTGLSVQGNPFSILFPSPPQPTYTSVQSSIGHIFLDVGLNGSGSYTPDSDGVWIAALGSGAGPQQDQVGVGPSLLIWTGNNPPGVATNDFQRACFETGTVVTVSGSAYGPSNDPSGAAYSFARIWDHVASTFTPTPGTYQRACFQIQCDTLGNYPGQSDYLMHGLWGQISPQAVFGGGILVYNPATYSAGQMAYYDGSQWNVIAPPSTSGGGTYSLQITVTGGGIVGAPRWA